MQGVYFIFGNFVIYSKKTSLMTWRADFLGGIATIILCPLIIKLNGPIKDSVFEFKVTKDMIIDEYPKSEQ